MKAKRLLLVAAILAAAIACAGPLTSSGPDPITHSLRVSHPLADDPSPPANPVKLIFVHHSTGENWLSDWDGGLGIALRDNNYFVSDTNYGWGQPCPGCGGCDASYIGSCTDIGHWWEWFRGPSSSTYMSALYNESGQHSSYSRLPTDPGGENQIIMFKSCFPNSHLGGNPGDPPPPIGSNPLRGQDAGSGNHTVANAKGIYIDLLQYFSTRQDKLFIVIAAPPLVENETDPTHADNARIFNNWLLNDWLAGYSYDNVAVFDFYNVLTSNGGYTDTNDLGWETGNHHRWWNAAVQHIQTVANNYSAYGSGAWDSHPTQAGNEKATGEFVTLLNVYYNRWAGGGATPTPTATGTPPTPTPSPSPTTTPSPPPGQQTMVFQQGVSPDPSYAGTTDLILANDASTNANLGGTENEETFIGDHEYRCSLIRWDISALPADITVHAASLELYHYDSDSPNDMDIALYRVTRSWDEGTGYELHPPPGYVPDGATWLTATTGVAWTTPGGDYDTTTDYGHGPNGIIDQLTLPAGMANGWIEMDVTAIVRDWVEQGVTNRGLALRPVSGSYTYHYFYSRNYAVNFNLRPRLTVTYTVGIAGPEIFLPITVKQWQSSASNPTAIPTSASPPMPVGTPVPGVLDVTLPLEDLNQDSSHMNGR